MRLAFTGDRNRPGKRDWSGAFLPEAKRYSEYITATPLDASAKAQRAWIIDDLRERRPSEVAFFCHGLANKIELGFSKANVDELALALAEVACDRVALYCCSTGGGPGIGGDSGFADSLRDAMCHAGLVHCRVLAHRTSGHCSMNPNKRLFEGRGSPVGGVGGVDIVRPGSELWGVWKRRLRDARDPLRWQLLELGIEGVHRELVGVRAAARCA
jgi:hypothetical protein